MTTSHKSEFCSREEAPSPQQWGNRRTNRLLSPLWLPIIGAGGPLPHAPPAGSLPGRRLRARRSQPGHAPCRLPIQRGQRADDTAHLATDGSTATHWACRADRPQWVYVDLGQVVPLDRVGLHWDGAYATSYQIQVAATADAPDGWQGHLRHRPTAGAATRTSPCHRPRRGTSACP